MALRGHEPTDTKVTGIAVFPRSTRCAAPFKDALTHGLSLYRRGARRRPPSRRELLAALVGGQKRVNVMGLRLRRRHSHLGDGGAKHVCRELVEVLLCVPDIDTVEPIVLGRGFGQLLCLFAEPDSQFGDRLLDLEPGTTYFERSRA